MAWSAIITGFGESSGPDSGTAPALARNSLLSGQLVRGKLLPLVVLAGVLAADQRFGAGARELSLVGFGQSKVDHSASPVNRSARPRVAAGRLKWTPDCLDPDHALEHAQRARVAEPHLDAGCRGCSRGRRRPGPRCRRSTCTSPRRTTGPGARAGWRPAPAPRSSPPSRSASASTRSRCASPPGGRRSTASSRSPRRRRRDPWRRECIPPPRRARARPSRRTGLRGSWPAGCGRHSPSRHRGDPPAGPPPARARARRW